MSDPVQTPSVDETLAAMEQELQVLLIYGNVGPTRERADALAAARQALRAQAEDRRRLVVMTDAMETAVRNHLAAEAERDAARRVLGQIRDFAQYVHTCVDGDYEHGFRAACHQVLTLLSDQ